MKKVMTIYDKKSELWFNPQAWQSIGEAVRAFGDICRDGESALAAHPEDYSLWCVGDFDERTGKLTVLDRPTSHADGFDYAKESGK